MERRTADNFLKNPNLGFTLIELLVSVTIITLLAMIGLSSFSSLQARGRDARRKADVEQVRTALELYRSQNGYYPGTGGGTWTPMSGLGAGVLEPDYIAKLSSDPLPSTHVKYKAYKYKATNLVTGRYYGYCIEANLETSTPTSNSCTPEAGYNLGARHP